MAFALFYLAGSPRVVPAVGEGIGTRTMSRTGVLVAIVLATGTLGAVAAIAAALLATVEPLPEALANPLSAGLVVTAGGVWPCAWYLALGLLLRLPALAVLAGAVVFALIGMLGPVAPALLAHSGTPAMVD